MKIRATLATGLAMLLLIAGCADGGGDTLAADPAFESQSGDTLTGIGEADDPLAGGAGDVSGSAM